jgi:hypothetical protein
MKAAGSLLAKEIFQKIERASFFTCRSAEMVYVKKT